MHDKRILIISHQFPPLLGAATFRSLKFTKYLAEFGWDPIVVCACPNISDVLDNELLDELPKSIPVQRVNYLHPRYIERSLLIGWNILWKMRLRTLANALEPYKVMKWIIPDPYLFWARPAYRAVLKLVKQYHPDVILTTSPPHSTQLVGLWLKNALGIPWVADLQDPWTQNPFVTYPTQRHLKINQKWERGILERADRIIATAETTKSEFQKLATAQSETKFHTITTGFEPSDFADQPADNLSDACLRIIYTGSLYGIRKADTFLNCIDILVAEGKIPSKNLQVKFIGPDGSGVLEKYTNRDWFSHISHQSHQATIAAISTASVLLLLIPPGCSQIPGKLFEYLGASKPILALAPPDLDAAHIVCATRAGVIAPPDNPTAISAAILHIYERWQLGQLHATSNSDLIAPFQWRQLTKQLANILNQVMTNVRD